MTTSFLEPDRRKEPSQSSLFAETTAGAATTLQLAMHTQFSENRIVLLEPHTIGLPCTPHLKSSTPLEPSTSPRLRTSMSSHSRLMPDDMFNETLGTSTGLLVTTAAGQADSALGLMDLPEEIHQRVLDMLMGELRPTTSSATDSNHALRNWNHAMRHPRGRKLANLALVTPLWRRLIQERLYRHGKGRLHFDDAPLICCSENTGNQRGHTRMLQVVWTSYPLTDSRTTYRNLGASVGASRRKQRLERPLFLHAH